MNLKAFLPQVKTSAALAAVSLGSVLLNTAAMAANLVQTNRTEHCATNLVEVKMQVTRIVTEYRTNWSEEVWNNIIDLYATNRVTKFYTNTVKVDLLKTNYVQAYRTNRFTVQQTNWATVPVFRTNLVIIDEFRTNFAQAYRTNVKALQLTNWVSVLVFKTNWVNQPVTNLVNIDLPAPQPETNPGGTKGHGESAGAPGVPTELLALEASRKNQTTGKTAEIKLTVHWTNEAAAPVQVEQWRVEREDGSMLLFGQGQEFRRPLPIGKYKIEVKARQPGTNQMLAALGTLSVLPGDVTLQQRTPGKNTLP